MVQVSLSLVRKPENPDVTVFEQKNSGGPPFTLFKGAGDIDYVCGQCAFLIVEGVRAAQIKHAVFLCPQCGSYNATRT